MGAAVSLPTLAHAESSALSRAMIMRSSESECIAVAIGQPNLAPALRHFGGSVEDIGAARSPIICLVEAQ
jgi:hypothetical protein